MVTGHFEFTCFFFLGKKRNSIDLFYICFHDFIVIHTLNFVLLPESCLYAYITDDNLSGKFSVVIDGKNYKFDLCDL